MSPDNPKIITTLRRRRLIEAAMRELGQIDNEVELRNQARLIAHRGGQVLPALIGLLDTPDPQVRGGLGQVATFLHESAATAVIEALRTAAQDIKRSDRARITAITILERYLQQAPDDALYGGLADPNALMLNSLREVLAGARQTPLVYVDYVQQLEAQPFEIAMDLLAALSSLEPQTQLDLLAMLAQDPRDVVATQAIQALGRIRLPLAQHGLTMLLPAVSPVTRPIVLRNLRKLTLSGVASALLPAPPAGWRALVSGIDGQGNRAVWFVAPGNPPATGSYKPGEVPFLGLLLNAETGVRRAFSPETMPEARIPAPHTPGTMCNLLVPHSDQALALLEAPFDYGRGLAQTAGQRNYQENVPTPHEYRLLNSFIWQFAAPRPPAIPDIPPMQGDMAIAGLQQQAAVLLDHKAFATWFLHSELVYDVAERLLDARRSRRHAVDDLLHDLVHAHVTPQHIGVYRQRLLDMVDWLAFGNDLATASLARHIAASLQAPADLTHPFFLELARVGVKRAASNLRWGYDLRANPAWL